MLVNEGGENLHLLTQRYLEELVTACYPYGHLNDVTPWSFHGVAIEKVPGVYYYGFVRTAGPISRDGLAVIVPSNTYWDVLNNQKAIDYSLAQFLSFFDKVDTEDTEFVGWKISLDGGISSPTIPDPPPPGESDLSSLVSAQLFFVSSASPLSWAATGFAYALIRTNEYVKNVVFVHNGFYYQLDDVITTDRIQLVSANDTLLSDNPPAGSLLGVQACDVPETQVYGSFKGGNVSSDQTILPFSYTSQGRFQYVDFNDNLITMTIQPRNAGGSAVGGPFLVFDSSINQLPTSGVSYYDVSLRYSIDGNWYTIPDLKIKK